MLSLNDATPSYTSCLLSPHPHHHPDTLSPFEELILAAVAEQPIREPDVPAVQRLGGQDVGEEDLCEVPEVQQLVPAAAECHVEVRAVLLQRRLLQELSVLHWEEQRGGGEEQDIHIHTASLSLRLCFC